MRIASRTCEQTEAHPLYRMSQYLISFGVGTRMCGGQNLAQIVLRAALAAIVSNFDISANRDETNERTMEIKDAFVSLITDLVCSSR